MIQPEPVVIDGRSGVIVFMDAEREPVEPSDPNAVLAKVVFDDGGRSVFTVAPKKKIDLRALHLKGNENSGNRGHAGRPGQRGGSAPGDAVSVRPPTAADAPRIREHFGWRVAEKTIDAIAEKPDGGLIVFPAQDIPENRIPTEDDLAEVFGAEDAKQLVAQMAQQVPGDVIVSMELSSHEHYTDATTVTVEMQGVSRKGGVGKNARMSVRRQFIRDNRDGKLVAYEDYIELTHGQGKGISKAVMADAMHTYEKLGVDRVEMLANIDVGGYAWAKYGFKADDPAQLAETLMRRATTGASRGSLVADREKGMLDGVSEADKAALRGVITKYEDDPKLPWHIADTKTKTGRAVGKEILLEADWRATLRLDDPKAMKKFKTYINNNKKKR